MAWCFTEEATEFSEMLLSRLSNLADTAVVPALWLYEVVNVTPFSGTERFVFQQEKLLWTLSFVFASGHDFSRAVKD
jgi:hypothetical protein